MAVVRQLLESMVDPLSRALANAPVEDENISEEEAEAVRRSEEWFQHHEGIPFGDVVAELGFSMDEIRNRKGPA